MVIVTDFPPNIAKITAVFPRLPETVCFTYGDKIYFPNGTELAGDLMAHEEVHKKQQGNNPEAWWDRYLIDKAFRQEQEVEAYAVQYLFVKARRPLNMAKRYLDMFAHTLSTMYKLDLDKTLAHRLIRKKCLQVNNMV
jgi:hypothetical protein